MTDHLPDGLLTYFANQQQKQARAVNQALATLTSFERRLVHEAAVMGYVRGMAAGRHGEKVPPDASVLFEVVDSCISTDERFPYLAAAAAGRRRRVTRSRRWPGE